MSLGPKRLDQFPIPGVITGNEYIGMQLGDKTLSAQMVQVRQFFEDSVVGLVAEAQQAATDAEAAAQAAVDTLAGTVKKVELAAPTGAGGVGFLQTGTGAVPQTVEDVLKITITAKQFGVKGDGVTDDTVNIRKAVAAAAASGNRLLFTPGVYMVDGDIDNYNVPTRGAIELPSNIDIELDANATIQTITSGSDRYCIFWSNGKENIRIKGGKLLGDRQQHDYTGLVIPPRVTPTTTVIATHEFGIACHFYACRNIFIENCHITDFTGDCALFIGNNIAQTKCENVLISNCILARSRRNNLSFVRAWNVTVTGCIIRDGGITDGVVTGTLPRLGIDIEAGGVAIKSQFITITGNVFVGNVNGSINAYDGDQVSITGNTCDHAITLGYALNAVVSNNVLVAGVNAAAGTAIESYTLRGYSLVSSNVIRGFNRAIYVANANSKVSGNYIEGCPGGIWISSAHSHISDNYIKSGQYGVRLLTGAENVSIIGNKIQDTSISAVAVAAAVDVRILNNEIVNSLLPISVAGSTMAVIQNNYIGNLATAGALYAIRINSASVVASILDNTLEACTVTAGVIWSVALRTRIAGNKLLQCAAGTGSLVFCGAQTEPVVVSNNTLESVDSGSASIGIRLIAGNLNGKIVGNQIYNVGTGDFLSGINTQLAASSKVIRNIGFGADAGVIVGAGTDTVAENLTYA